jgi:hypothetical protein
VVTQTPTDGTAAITIQRRAAPTLRDALFSSCINAIQASLFGCAAKLQIHRYDRQLQRHLGRRVHQLLPEDLRHRLQDLGLDPQRFRWDQKTINYPVAKSLIEEIERSPPTCMLEVGCGNSTALFAALAERYDFPLLVLENYQPTIDYLARLLSGLRCARRVTIQKCAFSPHRYPNSPRRYRWYHADLAYPGKPFDFVFVDGPVASLVGRDGVLPQVLPYLASNYTFLIKDYTPPRPELAIWRQIYPQLVVQPCPQCHRLARLHLPLNGHAAPHAV